MQHVWGLPMKKINIPFLAGLLFLGPYSTESLKDLSPSAVIVCGQQGVAYKWMILMAVNTGGIQSRRRG